MSKPTKFVVVGALLACAVAIVFAVKDEVKAGIDDARKRVAKKNDNDLDNEGPVRSRPNTNNR